MARNDGVDRTTVRNQPRTESNIADAEAHNERQKACYRNEDIVPERSHLNIHFKMPCGSYQEMFRQMEQDGTISTRGLKQDAVHYGELVFDVNSAYFHNHGGYEFAQAFYAEAYRVAVDIVGSEQYILSAVMHADEHNQGMSKALDTLMAQQQSAEQTVRLAQASREEDEREVEAAKRKVDALAKRSKHSYKAWAPQTSFCPTPGCWKPPRATAQAKLSRLSRSSSAS